MSTVRRVKELKSLQFSLRVSERFRKVVELLAERENRSFANLLEVALFSYADTCGVKVPEAKGKTAKGKTAKKKAAKKR